MKEKLFGIDIDGLAVGTVAPGVLVTAGVILAVGSSVQSLAMFAVDGAIIISMVFVFAYLMKRYTPKFWDKSPEVCFVFALQWHVVAIVFVFVLISRAFALLLRGVKWVVE